jgi:hypothetical protein
MDQIKRMQELAGVRTGVELSDPELATRWWSRLEKEEKQSLLNQYLPSRTVEKMDNDAIYWLWLKQQKL